MPWWSKIIAEEDTLGAFISERCTLGGTVVTSELREAYESYCVELGEKPVTAMMLTRQLRKRGIEPKAGKSARRYEGIRLRVEGDSFSPGDSNGGVLNNSLTRAREREVVEKAVTTCHLSPETST